MTAFDLIDSIYARPQSDVPSHIRFITASQLSYLKDLIGADPEGGAMRRDGPGRWIWAPSGRIKYELTEDLSGRKHRIARLANLTSSETGRLF
jgi:hypothetical protein